MTQCIKFIAMILLIANYALVCSVLNFFSKHNRKLSSKITSFHASVALKILNIKVNIRGSYSNSALLTSNHLSYLDILVISSICPSIFITSKEVEQDSFLGLLSKLNNSIFVERRNRSTLLKDKDEIISVLSVVPVVLFAEGTSSNGEQVLPFKSSLFCCVETNNVSVQPICIKYTSVNGEKISEKNRDLVFYYGSIEFFPHFWKLFSLKSINIDIDFLNEVYSNSRKMVCQMAYHQINRKFMEII